MKKILIAFTAAMLVLTLCACGEDSGSSKKESSAAESSAASVEESSEEGSEASENSSDAQESALGASLAKVKEQITMPATTNDYTLKRIKRTFGIEESQIEDFAGMYCSDGVIQDQLLFITAKTDDDVTFIKQKFEEHLESVYNVIKNYTPEQVAVIEAAKVEVNGRTVSLVISSDADKIRAIFNGEE